MASRMERCDDCTSFRAGTDDAAVGDDALAAHEGTGLGSEEDRDTADVVGLADALQRRLALRGGADLRVVPQGARESV